MFSFRDDGSILVEVILTPRRFPTNLNQYNCYLDIERPVSISHKDHLRVVIKSHHYSQFPMKWSVVMVVLSLNDHISDHLVTRRQ
jgi:hypothetical protein